MPPWAVVGLGRQDELLSHADLVICGGGHGMVSKTLLAGVPMVVVPGGGDQWEIANRVVRQGSAQLVRPLTGESLAAAVTEVLSAPRYREAARRAGAQRRRCRQIRYGCAMKRSRRRRRLGRVRLTEFHELVEGQFGSGAGRVDARRPRADGIRRTNRRPGHRGRRRPARRVAGAMRRLRRPARSVVSALGTGEVDQVERGRRRIPPAHRIRRR